MKGISSALGIALLLFGCAQQGEQPQEGSRPQMSPIEREKMHVAQERAAIENYIEAHEWTDAVERDGMGMTWLKINEGDGVQARMGDVVVYEATLYLLDDSGVGRYTDTIKLGFDQVELVLHEAMDGMREGDKSIVLVPSFLAHGMAGDLDKIPPRSPLRYDLRLIRVNP